MGEETTLLRVEKLYKSFGATKALKDVKLELLPGEVLGLIGENGSGKSTLTSIIAGIQTADSGQIYYEGKTYSVKNSVEANEKGICMILQEKSTFDHLSVAQNIFIGREQRFIKHGLVNTEKMNAEAEKMLKAAGAGHIHAGVIMSSLNFEEGKLVELARALVTKPKILMVDETTTALSRTGRDILYSIMEKLRKDKSSVIFISHDIDEMMSKCDRLTVLRDGVYIETLEKKDFSASVIRKLMVGRELTDNYYRTDLEGCRSEEIILSVENVSTNHIHDISFALHKGEILGFGGLADSGMHEVGKVAFGVVEPQKGAVRTSDGTVIKNPRAAMNKKIAYIGKNRDQESLFTNGPIGENIACASYKKLEKMSFISQKKQDKFCREWAEKLDVKMKDIDQYVMELSGGNKQKVALAKWLGFGADVFILDCPTRGIDIGVKTSIYKLMEKLKEEGKSIILISEELPEIIGMCDRVIVLKDGLISGEFLREEGMTEGGLINYMV